MNGKRTTLGLVFFVVFTADIGLIAQVKPPDPAPRLFVAPAPAPRDALLRVNGTGFAKSPCGVELFLLPGGLELAKAAPDEEGSFAVEVRLPGNVTAGGYGLLAEGRSGADCAEASGERAEAGLRILEETRHLIRLRTRAFLPAPGLELEAIRRLREGGPGDSVDFLLQFHRIPNSAARAKLAGDGIELHSYLSGNAYLAAMRLDALENLAAVQDLRWAGPLDPADKIAPDLHAGQIGSWARRGAERAVLTLVLHARVDAGKAELAVREAGGEIVGFAPDVPSLTAAFGLADLASTLEKVARLDVVQSVDVVGPPLEAQNDGARAQAAVDPLRSAPYGLSGAGVQVMVYDSGQVDSHPDFGTRVTAGDTAAVRRHSTHVAGIIAGSGANSNGVDSAGNPNGGAVRQWAGMAPSARILSFGVSGDTDSFYDTSGDLNADFASAVAAGADLANMSLGNNVYLNCFPCAQLGDYANAAMLLDNIVQGAIGGQALAVFNTAGNERIPRVGACSLAGCAAFGSISSPGTAKNPIVVGSFNSDTLLVSGFSSLGPTDDGRLKPDITAPGCQIGGDQGITAPTFQDSNGNGTLEPGETRNTYVSLCGTSMAAPVTAGAAALVLEEWRSTRPGFTLAPHTLKAILVHTAADAGNGGPDYGFGWGILNAQGAVDLVRASRDAHLIHAGALDAAEVHEYFFESDGSSPVAVTLAWDDPPATRLAAATLVNDLDLRLEDPTGIVYRPFILNPALPAALATSGNDAVNNVERTVARAARGVWIARVSGTSVPLGPEEYTLLTPGHAVRDLPAPDGCETAGSCSECPITFDFRRDFDRRILEDFSTVTDTAQVFRGTRSGMSLHDSLDVDRYYVEIPDPAGVHPDLRDCGTTTRAGRLPAGGTTTDQILFSGGMSIRAWDSGGVLDEPLGGGVDDTPTGETFLSCPYRDGLGAFCFLLGERPEGDLRRRFPRYSVSAEYRIAIQRISGALRWLRERLAGPMGVEEITALPCPGGFFPYCPDLAGPLEVAHPFRPRPDCRADGPGCPMFYPFRWASETPLQVFFVSSDVLAFEILDPVTGETIAAAIPLEPLPLKGGAGAGGGGGLVASRLAANLKPGLYVLMVEGPAGESFSMEFAPLEPPPDFVLAVEDAEAPGCALARVVLDAPEPVGGIQLGLEWKPAELVNVKKIRPGPAISKDDLHAFFVNREDPQRGVGPGQAAVGLVLSPGVTFGPGRGLEVLEIELDASPEAPPGETVSFCLIDGLGEPPLDTVVSVFREGEVVSVRPARDCGAIAVNRDTAAPVLECPDPDEVAVTWTPEGAVAAWKVSAGDDCSEPAITCDPPSGSTFGEGKTTVVCRAVDNAGSESVCEFEVSVGPPPARFRRGDANADRSVDISDPVQVLDYLFLGGAEPTCVDAADANDDNAVDISDASAILSFLFIGGPPPPAPGPFACGPDPTASGLAECAYRACR